MQTDRETARRRDKERISNKNQKYRFPNIWTGESPRRSYTAGLIRPTFTWGDRLYLVSRVGSCQSCLSTACCV